MCTRFRYYHQRYECLLVFDMLNFVDLHLMVSSRVLVSSVTGLGVLCNN